MSWWRFARSSESHSWKGGPLVRAFLLCGTLRGLVAWNSLILLPLEFSPSWASVPLLSGEAETERVSAHCRWWAPSHMALIAGEWRHWAVRAGCAPGQAPSGCLYSGVTDAETEAPRVEVQ